jgi:predicted transglutaminase-like cysteine proteinase
MIEALRRTLFAAVAISAFGVSGQAVHAFDDRETAYAIAGGNASRPIGWVQFCDDEPSACNGPRLRAVDVVLDEERWRELVRINARVNREVEPVTDEEQWGVVERWSMPYSGQGDCEDYVLEKRERLMNAGWPRQALLVTVVRDRKGDGHAVLTVKTDRGDFILDNQNPKVVAWTKTGYQYIKRQSQEDPNRWVSLGGVDTGVMTANQ